MDILDESTLASMMSSLPSDDPCGENLEYDDLYLALDELALGTPASEMGDSFVEGKDPDYRKLYSNCTKLWEKTRDLRVASFFTLSSMCLCGIDGLRQGLAIIDYLVKEQFDNVYPKLDPDDDNDPTERINILSMLSPAEGSFSDPYGFFNHLRLVKIVPELSYTFRDYLIGSGFLDGNDEAIDINQLNSQMLSIPSAKIQQSLDSVNQSISYVESICETFNEKIGDTGYLVMDSLKHELNTLKNLYKNYLSAAPVQSADKDDGSAQDSTVSTQSSPSVQQVQSVNAVQTVVVNKFDIDSYVPKSRNEALLLLKKCADYFSKAEPTSPVPFLIDRALRMANMNFIDLLGEIDTNALDRGREQLGVKPSQD